MDVEVNEQTFQLDSQIQNDGLVIPLSLVMK